MPLTHLHITGEKKRGRLKENSHLCLKCSKKGGGHFLADEQKPILSSLLFYKFLLEPKWKEGGGKNTTQLQSVRCNARKEGGGGGGKEQKRAEMTIEERKFRKMGVQSTKKPPAKTLCRMGEKEKVAGGGETFLKLWKKKNFA